MKRIFIAATSQNQGKTTISLGLIKAMTDRGITAGFIKPVGQRYIEIDGEKVDEDVVLMSRACGLKQSLKTMSPVIIARSFTREYIDRADNAALRNEITSAFKAVEAENEMVLIEGTGHAGVGSVIDLSNATVAGLLDSSVIIVSGGGIGKPIDEIALNACLFRSIGVEVSGAILNKVRRDKLDTVEQYTRRGLEQQGIRMLGAVPREPVLGGPTVRQVLDQTGGELLHGEEKLDTPIENTVLGAMTPHNALSYIGRNELLITPGDREDLILVALNLAHTGPGQEDRIAGLVLTGGLYPHRNIMRIIKQTDTPVIIVDAGTYEAASTIHDLTIKIHPNDTRKIECVHELVAKHVDFDTLLESN